jgi:hypothetical protein
MGTKYDEAFFSGHGPASLNSASAVLPIVGEIVSVKSVCDVGCGVGTWLRVWRDLGVEDIYGVDGNYVKQSQLLIDPACFHPQDLSQRLSCDRQFDLAMSMEVAEHLPPDRALSFVEDLTRLAPVVLFSAAIPMQGGTSHINEQWQDFWAELFNRHDFEVFDILRPRIWSDRRIARWYRQNMFLYCRRDSVGRFPKLAAASSTFPLSVVHPEQFLEGREEIDTRTAIQLTCGAVVRAINRRLERLKRLQERSRRHLPGRSG